jgi:TPR repeat protein
MARIEKTVFISYRRVDRWAALAVFKDLTHHGFDVFIDYDGIASGDFERAIVDNILACAHFVVLLTPTALDRCADPVDWLRREIEVALEAKRNIVPLLLDGFSLAAPNAVQRLEGALEPLRRYQALTIPNDFFDEAMERLRRKYLAIEIDAVLHPVSAHARRVALEQRVVAAKATDTAHAELDAPTGAAEQAALAVDYHHGRNGHAKDEAKAVKWYRKSAEQGNAIAQANLGVMYENGKGGLAKDDVEAVKWYRKSAKQGNAIAQANLGAMYESGRGGLVKDECQAVKWYRKSAVQGNALAQANLGAMYENGKGGLVKDAAEAVWLYRLAANQGSNFAASALQRLASSNSKCNSK